MLTLALSYGGRAEIVDATRRLCARRRGGRSCARDEIDEDAISRRLYDPSLPDPDLLIRTSGEMRVSNFLLWQIAYAEIWVTETLWPDFHRDAPHGGIRAYQQRDRRYGLHSRADPCLNRSASIPAPRRPHRRWYRRTAFARVAAGAVFVPLFVLDHARAAATHFLAFVDLVIVLGMLEFYGMMRAKGMHPYRGIGVLSGITLSTYIYFRSGMYANFFLTFIADRLMGLELARKDNRRAVYHVSTTVFGIMYVAYSASHFVLLRELPNAERALPYEQGASFVFLAFAVTWASDTGAYAIG